MTDKTKLRQFAELGRLIMDAKMLSLQRTANARQQSLARLADLDRPANSSDLPPILAAEVAIRYALWADQRRSEINLVLARQTVEWVEARQEAARAFGRSQVLQKLVSAYSKT